VERSIDGIRYRLDLSETIDSTIYYRASWEPGATSSVRDFLRPGMTAVDVGANIGYFTLLFAQLVGPAGAVIAFEPTTWAFDKLSRNIALNAFPNIVAEQMALSDLPGERETRSDQTAFRASWPVSGTQGRRHPELVRFIPLDLYVRRSGIQNVDLLKIDVDGYELRVVKGAQVTLRTHRPDLLIEIGRAPMREVGDRSEELVELLTELGYSFFTEDRRRTFSSGGEMLAWIPEQGANVWCSRLGAPSLGEDSGPLRERT
jgi:FkbM family methyltransferase